MEVLKIITIVFFIVCALSLGFLEKAESSGSYYQYILREDNTAKATIIMGFKCIAVTVVIKDAGDSMESEEMAGGFIGCRTAITAASFFFDSAIIIQSIAIFVFSILLIIGMRSKPMFITMVVLSSVALLCTIISMQAIKPISENYIKRSLEQNSPYKFNFQWSKGPSFLFLVGAVLFFIPQIALAVAALVLSCKPAYQPVTGSGTFSNSNH